MPGVISIREAVALIPAGGRVYLQGASGEPPSLAEALGRHGGLLDDVELTVAPLRGVNDCEYLPGVRDRARLRALSYVPALAEAVQEGWAEFVGRHSSEMPAIVGDPDSPFDVAFVQVAPPDGSSTLNLGTCVDLAPAAIANARMVIAEVNPWLPETSGASGLHVDAVTHLVQGFRPPRTLASRECGAVETEIARNVATVVPDGATIQVGIGGLADAVFAHLGGKRDLGIHSGLISDAVVELVRAGVVTGARKEIDAGRIVTTQCIGTQVLWDFIADNPTVEVHPVSYAHVGRTLAHFERFCAINFAVEVDLLGQVNSEWAGPRRVGAVGGQVDFLRGAARSPHGAAIIAMPATSNGQAVSRIVPRLAPERVTAAAGEVDVVVTEFGVAGLRGLDSAERAAALAAIAHPDFRGELRAAAAASR